MCSKGNVYDRLNGGQLQRYLPLSRLKTACPTDFYSPVNLHEVQSLQLKSGIGITYYYRNSYKVIFSAA